MMNISLVLGLGLLAPTFGRVTPCTATQQCPIPGHDEMPQVLIVGAGMAGISSAVFFQDFAVEDPDNIRDVVPFLIVESSNRVGGRMSSVRRLRQFPVDDNDDPDPVWLEECASWLYELPMGDAAESSDWLIATVWKRLSRTILTLTCSNTIQTIR